MDHDRERIYGYYLGEEWSWERTLVFIPFACLFIFRYEIQRKRGLA